MTRVLLAIFVMAILSITPAFAAEFNHDAHNTYLDEPDNCVQCHVEDAPSIEPQSSVCLECHDAEFVNEVEFPGMKTHDLLWTLNHGPFAQKSNADCASCHGQDDCMECHTAGHADEQGDFGNAMINVHDGDFRFTHAIAARGNEQRCTSCHENRFCVECHDQFAPEDLEVLSHRKGWSSIAVAGTPHDQFGPETCQTCHSNAVLPAHDWSVSHAREARKNLASCQACHPEGDICLKCHSATSGLGINPHPKDWDDYANRLKDSGDGRTCRKCH